METKHKRIINFERIARTEEWISDVFHWGSLKSHTAPVNLYAEAVALVFLFRLPRNRMYKSEFVVFLIFLIFSIIRWEKFQVKKHISNY